MKLFLWVLDALGMLGCCIVNVVVCILFSFVRPFLTKRNQRKCMALFVSSMRSMMSVVRVERILRNGVLWTKVTLLGWTLLVSRTYRGGLKTGSSQEVVSSQPVLAEAQACEANEHAAG